MGWSHVSISLPALFNNFMNQLTSAHQNLIVYILSSPLRLNLSGPTLRQSNIVSVFQIDLTFLQPSRDTDTSEKISQDMRTVLTADTLILDPMCV